MKMVRNFKMEPEAHKGYRGEIQLHAEDGTLSITLTPEQASLTMKLTPGEAQILAQELLRMAEGC